MRVKFAQSIYGIMHIIGLYYEQLYTVVHYEVCICSYYDVIVAGV